jgi:hypothetical protein
MGCVTSKPRRPGNSGFDTPLEIYRCGSPAGRVGEIKQAREFRESGVTKQRREENG